MIIQVNRSSLLSACQLALQVVPSRSAMPIYQNFRVEARNDRITVQATDLEIEVSYYVDGVVVDESGVAIWPAHKLVAILRECGDEYVSIDADDRRVKIHTMSGDFEMPGYDPTGFAAFQNPAGDGMPVEASSLLNAINRTAYAAAKDEGKYAMRGVLFSLDGKGSKMVATDGKRLGVADLDVGGGGKVSAVVPIKAVKLLASIAGEASEVLVGISAQTATFKTPMAVVHTRLVEGNFPPYSTVIPKKHESIAHLECSAFLHAVRQAAIMADEESKRVTIEFSKGKATMDAQGASSGKSKVTMPCDYEGDDVKISFDPVYLTEYLRGCADGERVDLLLNGSSKSVVFRGENYLYLVVPLV